MRQRFAALDACEITTHFPKYAKVTSFLNYKYGNPESSGGKIEIEII